MKSLQKIGICTGTQEEGPLKYERQVYRKGTSRHLPVPHALQCICGNFCYLWTWKLTDWLLNGSCIDIIPLASSCIYRFQHVIKRLARVGVSFSLRRQRPWQQRWRSWHDDHASEDSPAHSPTRGARNSCDWVRPELDILASSGVCQTKPFSWFQELIIQNLRCGSGGGSSRSQTEMKRRRRRRQHLAHRLRAQQQTTSRCRCWS